jgi:hypothetical protein
MYRAMLGFKFVLARCCYNGRFADRGPLPPASARPKEELGTIWRYTDNRTLYILFSYSAL